jgi:hypothetical protein
MRISRDCQWTPGKQVFTGREQVSLVAHDRFHERSFEIEGGVEHAERFIRGIKSVLTVTPKGVA